MIGVMQQQLDFIAYIQRMLVEGNSPQLINMHYYMLLLIFA
ncbi:hypothetical protein P4S68_06780 [Pseudoalteromonas sp. Hal099]